MRPSDPTPTDIDAADLCVDGVAYRYLAFGEPQPCVLTALTASERIVVQLIVKGLSPQAIADSRGTRKSTVDNQLAAVYRKLRVQSRHELIEAVLQPSALRTAPNPA